MNITNIDISFLIFSVLTLYSIVRSPKRINRFIKMFTKKTFLINLLPIIGFSVWTLTQPDVDELGDNMVRMKHATRQAIVAFMIAVFASIDLVIAPYWLIWIMSYYFKL